MEGDAPSGSVSHSQASSYQNQQSSYIIEEEYEDLDELLGIEKLFFFLFNLIL